MTLPEIRQVAHAEIDEHVPTRQGVTPYFPHPSTKVRPTIRGAQPFLHPKRHQPDQTILDALPSKPAPEPGASVPLVMRCKL